MKNNKGFVVSAVLYPLLVLFLALIMGLLAMTDTRKRILDKMKLEISDSIFDEATCSCDTILNKLNYLIKNGVGGGGGGSYSQNVLGLNVKTYESPVDIPSVGNNVGDIAVITETEMPDNNYYVSTTPPGSPKEGTIWIVQDINSPYYITSDYSKIGISYVMQYICDESNSNCEWQIKKAYVQDDAQWKLLYYVSMKDGIVDLTNTDINGKIKWEYDYTGGYQTFTAPYSGYYKVELWGAGSQDCRGGGKGSYTKGDIYFEVGQKIYIYVGGAGSGCAWNVSGKGGWNGGTDGGAVGSTRASTGGGGSTDIRLVSTSKTNVWNEFDSLKSRIMVAAGGGGDMAESNDGNATAAPGGGIEGYSGNKCSNTSYEQPTGGRQFTGGVGNSGNGVFGSGGLPNSAYGGGAGGGYFGGGHGYGGSGASGSSYISGHSGCLSITEDSTAANLDINGTEYHYSNYFFTNTLMIDGAGYSWSEKRDERVYMPTFDGNGTMIGNSTNGYAKITLTTIGVYEPEKTKYKKVYNYYYTGTVQMFNAWKSGNYQIELWGAGSVDCSTGYGMGAYTKGVISLSQGTILYVYVGSKGTGCAWAYDGLGGWNGGRNGRAGSTYGAPTGGGGSTDIRTYRATPYLSWNDDVSLKSRIMVAAGAGGGNSRQDASPARVVAGAGGGLIGYSGAAQGYPVATGGTQISGGTSNNASGMFGYGGFGGGGWGSGAGGGWYGGAMGYGGSGAGGSSYISGHAGCIAVTSEGLPKVQTYSKLEDSISHTGYKFTDTKMIDGNGYYWTTAKQTYVGMPTFDGLSTMTGNSGDGYAKITYLGQ